LKSRVSWSALADASVCALRAAPLRTCRGAAIRAKKTIRGVVNQEDGSKRGPHRTKEIIEEGVQAHRQA